MKLPTDVDPAAWHRHFAMSSNNRAWELAELPQRDTAAIREMLDAAHAAAWHWGIVGTEQHRMRAAMLLAQAHALAGDGAQAIRYASEVRDYFVTRADTPDWELAFAHAVHANAAHAAGLRDEHKRSYALARSAVDAIADAEDRAIVERTFAQVPTP